MSLEINTELLERAADCIDYWDGTIMADMLELDIENNDLESLSAHVSEAEAGIAREEFYASDSSPESLTERAEAMRDARREDGVPQDGEFDVV